MEERILIKAIRDDDPETSYLEQEGLGFEGRLDAYKRGMFAFVGITADHQRKCDAGCWHDVGEGGASCWGFEDDSGREYLAAEATEIANECGAPEGTEIVYDDSFRRLLMNQPARPYGLEAEV